MDFKISLSETILLISSIIGLTLSFFLLFENYALKVIIMKYESWIQECENNMRELRLLLEELNKEIEQENLENKDTNTKV